MAWVCSRCALPDRDWLDSLQPLGSALKPAHEPIVLARKPLAGTVAANVLEHGTGALNVDGCRIESADAEEGRTRHGGGIVGNGSSYELPDSHGEMPAGRWPANVCLDPEAAAMLDEQTGELPAGVAVRRNKGIVASSNVRYNADDPNATDDVGYGDSGGASRFLYVAKASSAERGCGGVRNAHPTVKPVELMRWLCRLVTPPGGLVLDPFAGSGSTGIAALREGFSFIGIEQDAEYVIIARARIIGDAPLLNAVTEAA